MPSASAMSVTVAPEARALAILVRRPSRRSSAVGLGCASSVIGVLRLLTRANRRDELVYVLDCRIRECTQKPASAYRTTSRLYVKVVGSALR